MAGQEYVIFSLDRGTRNAICKRKMDVWYDQRIDFGANWLEEIKDALERANASLLLISASFLGSEFINHKEIPQMLDRMDNGFNLFPKLARPCAWQTVDWLRKIQIRPENGEALSSGNEHEIDTHLANITLEVSKLLSEQNAEAS